jgi:hypothetical protein
MSEEKKSFFKSLKTMWLGDPDTPDLSRKQRFLRPVINFLVERYFPTHTFFGNDYLNVFARISKDKTEENISKMAGQCLIHQMIKEDAVGVTVIVEDLMKNGRNLGSYSLVVRKYKKPEIVADVDPRLANLDGSSIQ